MHPFTCMIAGSTGCGKSVFVERLIMNKHAMIHPVPEDIIMCYSLWQPGYDRLKQRGVKFVQGLPSSEEWNDERSRLIIIDDLMSEINERVTSLFTKESHHLNLSVILIVQNVFGKNKELRTISLNCHYLVLFKNPRDKAQIIHLGKQMYPGRLDFVTEAFNSATEQPHGYLLLDFKQNTPENLRLRTHIFPDQEHTVFIPRKR